MADMIVLGILLLVVGAVVRYIVKVKKSGKSCVGCSGCSAAGSCSNCRENRPKCGCGSQEKER